jgi:hypothetical protein
MIKYSALVGLAVLTVFTSAAQNFDSDSIYYTPIERASAKIEVERNLPDKKIHYFFNFLSGTLVGGSGMNGEGMATFTFSTVYGARFGKRLSVGAGLGFDSYLGWKAMPFFGSLSYDLFGKSNKVFVQLNYGIALVNKVTTGYEYGNTTNYNGRGMFNPSLGYKIVNENLRLYIQVGYKMQRINMNNVYPVYYSTSFRSIAPTPNSYYTDTELSINRAYFSIGFGWK